MLCQDKVAILLKNERVSQHDRPQESFASWADYVSEFDSKEKELRGELKRDSILKVNRNLFSYCIEALYRH